MTNINKVKIIKYDLSCNLDFDEKRVAFILFDLLKAKNMNSQQSAKGSSKKEIR